MSTITREFTKEQLIARINQVTAINKYRISRDPEADGLAMDNELARIALASLEAEPVITVGDDGGDALAYRRLIQTFAPGKKLYTAPPTPVVPEEIPKGLAGQIVSLLAHNIGDKFLAQKIWNACRAAMLQGKE
ncbi:hypothetical protein M8S60_00685 [Enterobacter asburiae]|uniref:hypothetical protein n=1 Tax=Enterobacter asburiae TaxID=61645 RepID=UPI0020762953|nr:hypothetical protein [Enterobacter asburiae]MCM7668179.1 hypothetical protein [Enterobacter asburiae]